MNIHDDTTYKVACDKYDKLVYLFICKILKLSIALQYLSTCLARNEMQQIWTSDIDSE